MVKHLIFVAFCAFTMHGCMFHGCEKVFLSTYEKEWFDCYEMDQQIVFQSNLGNLDTFIVTRKDSYLTECNQLEVSQFQYEKYALTISPKVDKKGYNDDIEVYFTKYTEVNPCNACFYVFDLYWCGDTLSNDILTCKKGSGGTSMGDHLIESFIWTKGLGLTEYITTQKEIFRIQY